MGFRRVWIWLRLLGGRMALQRALCLFLFIRHLVTDQCHRGHRERVVSDHRSCYYLFKVRRSLSGRSRPTWASTAARPRRSQKQHCRDQTDKGEAESRFDQGKDDEGPSHRGRAVITLGCSGALGWNSCPTPTIWLTLSPPAVKKRLNLSNDRPRNSARTSTGRLSMLCHSRTE